MRFQMKRAHMSSRVGIVCIIHQCYASLKPHATGTLTNMTSPLLILGLESSCDDTAAAVLRHGPNGAEILSSQVYGQTELHADFGGVVPEIAARAHAEKLDHMVEAALVAVTSGPGLIGGVMAGVMCAKGIAAGAGIPLIGVNHLAGHALTPRLTDNLSFPYLMLLVSGGHCQFLIAHSATNFERLGGTIDDAPGEAFDKVAKLINLPQPGGPSIENAALAGNPKRFKFPRPLLDRAGCDLSFSGLKTAVLRERDKLVAAQGGLFKQDQNDIAASFQTAVTDTLAEKTRRAVQTYLALGPTNPAIAVAGGVAANGQIQDALKTVAKDHQTKFTAPPLALCTDNAAMIAWVGVEHFRLGLFDDLTLAARPRWPLDATSAPMLGSGKKGAKA
jgi:N6-L-threonylcarbamoyladenine synthase